jgi:MFS family permease
MLLLVMAWLSYELTDSPFLVALFTAARLVPTLSGPFIGAIADRVDRRKFMLLMMVVQVIFIVLLAALTATGRLQFWHLAVVGFVDGLIFTAISTTGYALAMDIVGEESITNAVALNVVAMDITRVVGPAVGGVLVATLGPANCFWTAGVVCVFAFVALLPLKLPMTSIVASTGSVLKNITEGFKYVMRSRAMLSVMGVSFAANIFLWPAYQSFMPIFAKDNLGLGPDGLGYLQSASGVGALIGALVLASMGNFRRKGLIYLWGTGFMAVFFGAFAMSMFYPVALVLVGMFGLCSAAFGTLQATLMLLLAPEDMRGRASGFLRLAIGVYAPGAVVMGAIANVYGVSLVTGISCGILALIILAMAVGIPSLRRM